ncbi:hydroxyethylthiazole kinase [Pantoea sp. 1.19]|uniref:hydroxyethylthiazole kinase n=1 Tax=Pantoea sp. 1.19 TaxID=1925589 RepID=UPI0009491616|nr:hydroxyethylthiazole kinase [Pantoea sp. 1.19]
MTPSDPLADGDAAAALTLFTQRAPLIHCLTNEVVQALTANVLLALGASPAMVVAPQEVAQFSAVADALLINVGTLTADRRDSMAAAVRAARAQGTPWVLDPVAAGALTFRTDFCRQLLREAPAAIRGNASEILALAGEGAGGRGVDSRHDAADALAAARDLARRVNTVVAVTGEVDYVTDGERLLRVPGGSPLMARVTGTGCALSAVVAGFCALPGDRLILVASACRVMAGAGQRAAAAARGPGSFLPGLVDALWQAAQAAQA